MAENKQALAGLYKKYNLGKDDIFKHRLGFVIITRTGIEKIQMSLGLEVEFDIVSMSDDHKYVVVKATGVLNNSVIQTYGEASPDNNKMGYPVAMAEKRALSRVTLKAAGLYAEGVYGEDEADDFRDRKGSSEVKVQVQEKKASPQQQHIDGIIKGAKQKLSEGLANPIQVMSWFEENKEQMTENQRKEMEKILSNY
ncbi:MAG: hypothetical protein CL833_16200 [Crocinitomicaceae bacterium]|nr:hypothetical protein [Crocinitomicaceae bacterium]